MLGKFSVKKPYTVLVAVILIIVLGVVSLTKMSADLLPSISLPYVIVMTPYPGASPETVEMVVTKPVESSMVTVSNIEDITSVSSENYSMVIMEFAQTTDMNSASLEIRENLDQIKSYWSDSVGNPIIMKLNPDMLPVMIAAVGGVDMESAEVTKLTQDVVIPEMESIEGVASASATGLLEESINVIIRQDKIDRINKQVFGSIDKEMEDAKTDLEESRQEVYDGQKELEDAKGELADSEQELAEKRQDLEDAKAELEDSKIKLADGRNEIASNREKLDEGKAQLEGQKASKTREIAEMETQLITMKADAEAAKTHMQTELASLQAAVDTQTTLSDKITEVNGTLDGVQGLTLQLSGVTNPDTTEIGSQGLDLNSLNQMFNSIPGISNVAITETTKVSEVNSLLTQVEGILVAQKDNLTSMRATITESINEETMGLGYEAYAQQINGTIAGLNENIRQLDEGLTALYQGNLTAAIEFSNAQSQLSLAELQIKTAESQLDMAKEQIDSGEEQLESGYDQLESGQKQIDDAYEQLKDSEKQLSDALEQIADGEEQLQEAWDKAYDKADMNGILTVETVEKLLAAQNFSMPAGYVTEDGISYLIRVGDKPDDMEQLKKMPILNPEMDGVDVITLGDVADVFQVDNSADIYTNVNGSPGIMISMQKQTGYSTGDVSDRILDKFKELSEENPNLILITLMDQGIYIDLVMDSIVNNILFGGLLAILILIVFLKDIRPTAVIACSIPISLVTAIVCMYFSGVTLNVISLSGLALGIGMLVDNSIVVIENIYRLRGLGVSAREAAVKGAGEVAGAIMASTLTTVCVFLPIVFTEGITRQLFVDMGLTIAYSLGASLLVALTVVPAMASKTLRKTKDHQSGKLFTKFMDVYERVLALALRFKAVVFLGVLVLLVISAYASYLKGTAFMPEMDSTQMTMNIELPDNTPLAHTREVGDEVVKRLLAMEDVVDVGAMTSTSTMAALSGSGDASTNELDIYISLRADKKTDNNTLATQIMNMLQDVQENEEAKISIETSSMDMTALGGSGISIQVQGRDLDKLQEIAKEVAVLVEQVEGTENVTNGLEDATGELRVIIDRDKAIEHGLTVAEIFGQISNKLEDATSATTLETEIKEYNVYVKNEGDMALTRKLVEDIVLERTDKDNVKEKIPLKEVASFENTISPKAVNRSQQNRYIEVHSDIAEGYNVGLVSRVLEKELENYETPDGYRLVIGGENEMIVEAMKQLLLMLLLAIIFMYLIMVAQFQSLLSPFIIMFTIPLAFTGGFFGLVISNSELSVISLIGFVMLAGIIVNNGIVLVDYINQLCKEGMEKREAILKAGRTRVRPVLMTALTTILALCTMVFGNDMGSEMSKPMAVVTIGGLIYGTILTLLVIPCVYDVFVRVDKKREE